MKNYNQDVKFILYENLKLELAKTNDDMDNFSCDVLHLKDPLFLNRNKVKMTVKTRMNNTNTNHPDDRSNQEDGLYVALKVIDDVFKYYISSLI